MSVPGGRAARDERSITFVIIPHQGDTRSYELSYRALRWLTLAVAGLALALVGIVGSWVWMSGQAARVPLLQREIIGLRRETARVEQLSRMVAQLEARYQQVRTLLGTNTPRDTAPQAADSVATNAAPREPGQ